MIFCGALLLIGAMLLSFTGWWWLAPIELMMALGAGVLVTAAIIEE